MSEYVIYDLESYPNVFTYCAVDSDGNNIRVYEISDRKNQTEELLQELRNLKINKSTMVGFNNSGYDYNLIHFILEKAIKAKAENKQVKITANQMFKYTQKVIDSYKGDGFGIKVKDDDIIIQQIDLYLINHFNNKAKATSLKMLEFNMRSDNIEDLPYAVGSVLNDNEKDVLIKYNKHDVMQTLKFYNECKDMISFRKDITEKYGFSCHNLDDTKIGAKYFMSKIEKENPTAFYTTDEFGRRKMKQSKRDSINIGECLFDYVKFKTPRFQALYDWFSKQNIKETNGVFSNTEEHLLGDLANYCEMVVKKTKFKDKPTQKEIDNFLNLHPKGWIEEIELKSTKVLRDNNGTIVKEKYIDENGKDRERNVKVPNISYMGCYNVAETINVVFNDFRIDYGLGGVHGAKRGYVKSDDEYVIVSADVASMYPNIAIANRVYPEHLGESFCDSYEELYQERKKYPKGTPDNLSIKLSLNSVYGKSSDKYSPFYDPKYTMSITVNGQMSLTMLMERICLECDARLIMCNSDGYEVLLNRNDLEKYHKITKMWEKYVGLDMEIIEYKAMYIADVNNYIAIYSDGKVKMKGRYEYKDLAWNKNFSSLVIAMAVDKYITEGVDYKDFVLNHKNEYDFMLRTKVPRNCELILVDDNKVEHKQQNICRYYPSKNGGKMVKIMPPLEGKTEYRRMAIESDWKVKTCNNMKDFDWDIDYDYYIKEVGKLLEPFDNEITWNIN